MSDWHFGMDYDMWLYPPVDFTAPDYDFELPEPIEAANIEGTLLVNAEDAIEQVRRLQAENAKLREDMEDLEGYDQMLRDKLRQETELRVKAEVENAKLRELVRDMMRFFEDSDWCDKCNHARECDSQEQYEGDCLMRLVFRDRMRELEVEVDA